MAESERRIELRHFLYLDDPLLSELLAQIEEGEFDNYQYQQSSASSAGVGGRIGVPVAGVSAQDDRTTAEAVTYAGRLTPASRFARFLRLLRERGGIVEHSDWTRLRPGDFVLSGGAIHLTGLTRLALGFRELDRSQRLFHSQAVSEGPLVRRAWGAAETTVRRLARRPKAAKYRVLAKMAEEMGGGLVPVVSYLSGSPVFSVLMRLRAERLRVDHPTSLEGEMRVLFKVLRLLVPGEVVTAAEPFPGAKPLGDAFLQGVTQAASGTEYGDLLGATTVSHPGALGLPIAVFQ